MFSSRKLGRPRSNEFEVLLDFSTRKTDEFVWGRILWNADQQQLQSGQTTVCDNGWVPFSIRAGILPDSSLSAEGGQRCEMVSARRRTGQSALHSG